jgi:hypothetical protein
MKIQLLPVTFEFKKIDLNTSQLKLTPSKETPTIAKTLEKDTKQKKLF